MSALYKMSHFIYFSRSFVKIKAPFMKCKSINWRPVKHTQLWLHFTVEMVLEWNLWIYIFQVKKQQNLFSTKNLINLWYKYALCTVEMCFEPVQFYRVKYNIILDWFKIPCQQTSRLGGKIVIRLYCDSAILIKYRIF